MRSPVTVVAAEFEDLVKVGLRQLISEDENLELVASDVPLPQITGVIDAIDYKNRYVALRGPGQNTLALPVSADVKNFDQVKPPDGSMNHSFGRPKL